jgi:hypothetical protein
MNTTKMLCFSAFLACGAALMGAAGCDDTQAENEEALPGVGPIGAGGAPYLGGLGGAGGAGAGEGGASGAGAAGAGAGTAGASGAASGGAGAGGAACEGGGKARLRVANLVPRAGQLELCARKASAADFSDARRLVKELGDTTRSGLAFREVSKGFEIDGGGWVLKAIDAAATSCEAPGVYEGELCLNDQDDVSALAMEGQLLAVRNAGPTEGNRLRFLHAYAGEGPLDVGLVDPGANTQSIDDDVLLAPPVFAALGFGQIAPAGVTDQGFPVLATGYLDLPLSYNSVIPVGAAPAGTTTVLFTVVLDFKEKGRTMTAFGVGKKGDPGFPFQAVLCDETKESGVLASCTVF